MAIGLATAANANELPRPVNDIVLTVIGDIALTNTEDGAEFDLEMLAGLDATTIETETIWTMGNQVFKGVALNVLLNELEVTQGILLASAINDYTVEIPVTDAVAGGPIIAYSLNGELMSVRDKGPLWIIYPYDSNADYQSEVIYSRSIWQLDQIEIVQ